MAYELLVEKDVDLSKLGFGNNLVIEFDPEQCMLRVSVFEEGHFQDEIELSIADKLNGRCRMNDKDSIHEAKESIKVIKALLSTHQWEAVRHEFEFAIHELEKCIPTKLIKENWCPTRCPNCGADLGGECDDGYYENPHYEYCPQCRQILDYD